MGGSHPSDSGTKKIFKSLKIPTEALILIKMIYKNSFYIESFGCSFNKADSLKLKSLLIEKGYFPSFFSHSEFIFINTCAVKSQTHNKIIDYLKNLYLDYNQKIIILGCLPWISSETLLEILNSNGNIIGIINLNQIQYIFNLIKICNNQYIKILPEKNKIEKSKIKPWIDNLINDSIIQISEGCNNFCSYCCTRLARNYLYCYNFKSIIENIKFYIKIGVKEIYLTSQDCGSYNYNNVDLISLLRTINKNIESLNVKNIFIRLGMLNPKYLINNIENLIEILRSDYYYKFLHIPIQSASDKILDLMKRRYNKRDIENIFEYLRTKTDFVISTDIICGFPNENEDDFQETIDFIERYKPEIINISKYTVRPNIISSKFEQIKSEIIKARSIELTNIYNKYKKEIFKKWIGWTGKAFINKFHTNKIYHYSGRNIYYLKVILNNVKINEFFNIKVNNILNNNLIADLL